MGNSGTIITSKAGNVAATMTVPLLYAAPGIDITASEEKQVVVTGILQDGHLVISSADDVTLRIQAGPNSAVLWGCANSPFIGEGQPRRVDRRHPAERALMEQGMLLDAWTDEQTERRIALATDTEAVQAILSRHYGDALVVIKSRWSREYLNQIRATVDEGLVISSGNAISPDLQMQVALTLLHLPTHLARRLSQFSAEALALKVLIKPRPEAPDGGWR
jgi:hypothetical protein